MMDDLHEKYASIEAKVDEKLSSLVKHQYTAAIVVGAVVVLLFLFSGVATVAR